MDSPKAAMDNKRNIMSRTGGNKRWCLCRAETGLICSITSLGHTGLQGTVFQDHSQNSFLAAGQKALDLMSLQSIGKYLRIKGIIQIVSCPSWSGQGSVRSAVGRSGSVYGNECLTVNRTCSQETLKAVCLVKTENSEVKRYTLNLGCPYIKAGKC